MQHWNEATRALSQDKLSSGPARGPFRERHSPTSGSERVFGRSQRATRRRFSFPAPTQFRRHHTLASALFHCRRSLPSPRAGLGRKREADWEVRRKKQNEGACRLVWRRISGVSKMSPKFFRPPGKKQVCSPPRAGAKR